jgi:hypothetical protein
MKPILIFLSVLILLITLLAVVSGNLLKPEEATVPVISAVKAHQEPTSKINSTAIDSETGVNTFSTLENTDTATRTPYFPATSTPSPTITITPTVATPSASATSTQDPALWKEWPVMPVQVSDDMRRIYQEGIRNGNDPKSFSILGDCQSQPEVFMGVYDTNPETVLQLNHDLQEAAANFHGSFNRYSPTVKDGTTEAALLWSLWNDNKAGLCEVYESPLDCELRVHNPIIAFLHVGTHWEARNEYYLTQIIEKLLANGTVPIVVTKADNREFDERVNKHLVKLAAQYNLPLWNFWASVQDLPNHGMEYNSNMYLSSAGLEVHQQDALKVLDFVWRELQK